MDPQELIEMLMAGGESWDVRRPPHLPMIHEQGNPLAERSPGPKITPIPGGSPAWGPWRDPLPRGGPYGQRLGDAQDFIDQQMNPEEGEPYQVAGDVVPTSRYLPIGQAQDIQRRMSDPDRVRGSMGQLSIDTMGGAKSPYIDLMDVLMGRMGTRR